MAERIRDILNVVSLCEHGNLTHFKQMLRFYIPENMQKTAGFLVFPGCLEKELWFDVG